MATLSIPYSFTAGTPALASEVNANFQAIVTWTQSNIGTDNLGILTARSIALPSAPTLAILSLQQTSSQPALAISNTGSDTSVTLTQGALLATNKSVFLLNDPINQSNATAAHMRMTLSGSTNIPALEIIHGSQNTLKVQRTGITTDVSFAANSLSSTASVSAASILSSGLVTITAPVSDAIALKIKGRSSDNSSKIVFKNNADSSEYASLEVTSSKLIENVPTGSSYEFKVNNVVKGLIDSSGVDGQYLKAASVTEPAFVSSGFSDSGSRSFVAPHLTFAPRATIATLGTLTITQPRQALFTWRSIALTSSITATANGNLHIWVEVSGPGGFSYNIFPDDGIGYTGAYSFTNILGSPYYSTSTLNSVGGGTSPLILMLQSVVGLPSAGTYTVTLYAGSNNGATFTMNNFYYSGNILY
jgi:hypothetical protein